MKQQYEKRIKCKTLWLSIKHHFILFFSILGVMMIAGVLASTIIVKKEYQSEIKIENQTSVNYVHLNNLSDLCSDKRTITMVANSLNEKGVLHSNGNPITESEILSGIISPKYRENGYSITVLFQSFDSSITKPVLNELGEIVIPLAGELYDTFYTHFRVSNPASEPIKISQEKKTLYIFIVGGFLLSYMICFFLEVFNDRVRDKSDIEEFCDIAMIEFKSKNKKSFLKFLSKKEELNRIDCYIYENSLLVQKISNSKTLILLEDNTSKIFFDSAIEVFNLNEVNIKRLSNYDRSNELSDLNSHDSLIIVPAIKNKTKIQLVFDLAYNLSNRQEQKVLILFFD